MERIRTLDGRHVWVVWSMIAGELVGLVCHSLAEAELWMESHWQCAKLRG